MTSPEMTLLQAQSKPLPASRDPSPAPSRDRSHIHGHHTVQNGGPASGPGLAQGSSPSPVKGLPRISVDGQPQHSDSDDVELVNNWNDSDADGLSHDEQEEDRKDVDSDNAQGYVVKSEASEEESSPAKATRARTRATRKSKRS